MSVNRKAVFLAAMAAYHNSFLGESKGVFTHSRTYLRNLLEAKDKDLSAEAMRLDPRLTSTDIGGVAYVLAKAVSEDKEIAPHFVDIELTENRLIVTFEHQAKGQVIERVLGEVGNIGFLARPGDRLSDQIVSDMFIVCLDPKSAIKESITKDLKARFTEAKPLEELGSSDATGGTDGSNDDERDSDNDDTQDDDEDGGKAKKKGAAKKDKAQEKDSLEGDTDDQDESVVKECEALGLNKTIFVEKLSSCALTKQVVESLFARYLGEKSVEQVLRAPIAGNVIEKGNEIQERGRLIRVLASRGLLESGVVSNTHADVVKVIEGYTSKLTAKESAKYPNSDVQYSDLIEDVMVALDSAHAQDIKPLYQLCVEKTVPLALSTERVAKLVGYIGEAAAKNEREVLMSLLKATAKIIVGESNISVDESEADIRLAWKAYVTEATKVAPEPKDEAAAFIDALLPA